MTGAWTDEHAMYAAIVIPCLNEEATLARTCRSLGFGDADAPTPQEAELLLVDNGSIDHTRALMVAIAESSPPGSVRIFEEAERGFVPPRHRGATEARARVQREGRSEWDVALIQADADTVYSQGYVDRMRQALLSSGPGALAEAETEPPPDFFRDYSGYVALSSAVDTSVARWNTPEANDVVIDDKTAALRLGDYFRWGGHQREYDWHGDEIHAETARLFMRGKARGASKIHVTDAVADPSRRKVLADPALYFATAGFPREEAWKAEWKRRYRGPNAIEAFQGDMGRLEIAEAVQMRQSHSIILFAVLPRLVAQAAGTPVVDGPTSDTLEHLCSLVAACAEDLDQPGQLLTRSFSLIEDHPQAIGRLIEEA